LYNDNVDVHTLRKARMLLENKIAKTPASLTTICYRTICYVLLTTKAFDPEQVDLHSIRYDLDTFIDFIAIVN